MTVNSMHVEAERLGRPPQGFVSNVTHIVRWLLNSESDVCVCVCARVCLCVRVSLCVYIYMNTCLSVCLYVQIH